MRAVRDMMDEQKSRDQLLQELAALRRQVAELRAQPEATADALRQSEARRKAAEDALRQSEATARALLESAAQGVIAVDRDGRIVLANARAAEMFGYERNELLGQPVDVLVPERLRGAHAAHRAGYFVRPRQRPMGTGLDLTGRRRDGTEFPIEVSLSFIPTDEGGLGVSFVTDITEWTALQRQARQAEKLAAIGTLAAGIAHEIINPLAVVSARIEVMLLEAEEQGLSPETRADLDVIHRHIRRLTRIAEGLLTFARQGQREPKAVNVNAVVEDVLLLVGKQMSKDGVEITTSLDPGVPPILGDSIALEQVLLNLLINARDAMRDGGAVRIETARAPDPPGAIRLVVADTGAGIPSDVLRRIAEPFFTTKQEGTGLGLSVSYKIIREHAGTVEVRSQPGEGTTFSIVLAGAPANG